MKDFLIKISSLAFGVGLLGMVISNPSKAASYGLTIGLLCLIGAFISAMIEG